MTNIFQPEVALIISGGAISKIQETENLKPIFLELCDKAKVVLACRVTPK
jgi:hypothetical protein